MPRSNGYTFAKCCATCSKCKIVHSNDEGTLYFCVSDGTDAPESPSGSLFDKDSLGVWHSAYSEYLNWCRDHQTDAFGVCDQYSVEKSRVVSSLNKAMCAKCGTCGVTVWSCSICGENVCAMCANVDEHTDPSEGDVCTCRVTDLCVPKKPDQIGKPGSFPVDPTAHGCTCGGGYDPDCPWAEHHTPW